MSTFKIYNKWHFLVILSVLLSIFAIAISKVNLISKTETQIQDVLYRITPENVTPDSNVVIIAIDDSSLEFTRNNRFPWPWSRDIYGIVTEYLTSAGAEKIMYDLQFTDPDFDRAETLSEETDGYFAEAMRNCGNVILGVQLVPDNTGNIEIASGHFDTELPYPADTSYYGILSPLQIFLENTDDIGIVNVEPDDDGVIRKLSLQYKIKGNHLRQFALSALSDDLMANIPVDSDGNCKVLWYGKGGSDSKFKYYTMGSVIQSAINKIQGQNSLFREDEFKGKYVIIGTTAGGLLDLKTVPTDRIFPGMEIWATALSNYLNQHFVRELPRYMLILILLITVLLITFSYKFTVRLMIYIIPAGLLVLHIAAFFILWKHMLIQYPILNITLTIIITYLINTSIHYLNEGRARKQITGLFSRYLHPKVIDELITDQDSIEMGGKEIEATVLFTDIANFTTFSEGVTANKLVHHLNEYFEDLTTTVLNNRGLLDKYTGDGIMALFGVPAGFENHAFDACNAALLYRISKRREITDNSSAAEKFAANTRIGINTGTIVAGNIGSNKRMDYTAIGDPVNLAARLEGVNKFYGTSIIISDSTYKLVSDRFICRELDSLKVKGKNEPTIIYELQNFLDCQNCAHLYKLNTVYSEGLKFYRLGQWDKAIKSFKTCIEQYRDRTSQIMLMRCEELKENPPTDWTRVFVLDKK